MSGVARRLGIVGSAAKAVELEGRGGSWPGRPWRKASMVGVAVIAVALLGAACGTSTTPAASTNGKILAVGAENEYANVIGQIGGKYVQVSSILSNPNTDPHTFESSPSVAQVVSAATLIVQNGVGYDTFMNTIESASPSPKRKVIDVQNVLGLPTNTPNPHLWYNPRTMPAVAKAVATDLSDLQPAHASFFHANASAFTDSLTPWLADIAKVRAAFPRAPVATTEPVGDYMLQAAGTDDLTPWSFSADVMNGVDTTPQDNAFQESLFNQHKVKVFVYNQQVTNSITQLLLSLAHNDRIPVVGVYETMPVPGYDYQTWMEAETIALYKALANGTSTEKL
jgi:zinc/manganese transport system substrate-binding protein